MIMQPHMNNLQSWLGNCKQSVPFTEKFFRRGTAQSLSYTELHLWGKIENPVTGGWCVACCQGNVCVRNEETNTSEDNPKQWRIQKRLVVWSYASSKQKKKRSGIKF